MSNRSSMSAILSTLVGAHFGHVFVHIKEHPRRLTHWSLMGLVLLLVGIILHFSNGEATITPQIYTTPTHPPYFPNSLALPIDNNPYQQVLVLFHLHLCHLWARSLGHLDLLCRVPVRMNMMLIYVMAAEKIFAGFINGWYIGDPSNTLVNWIRNHIFISVWHSRRVGVLLYVIFVEILFWFGFAGVLHSKRIYWKL
ncbi:hypothetical protein V2J09_007863 [Rumex salicifolius]